MKRDSKLSGILHVLLHMAEFSAPTTSETLASLMQTNPAVIRRTMAGLRERGYVRSEKGHGGGWTLECDLTQLTLADVWRAIGEPSLIALANRTEAPGCLVEQAVNHALNSAIREAENLLIANMEEITLAMLQRDFHHHMALINKGAEHEQHQ
ncbi:Rrf2 family transcriptional regulator [Dryocola sp. BD613]|uniref:Rrf2 family transcriptional regulator n=1 Tax=Dryocola sp. BD613 TaxID=3133272 RepID=UPI003F503960